MKPGLQSDMGTFLLAGPGLRIWVLTLSIHIGLSLFICRICVSVLNIYVCKPYYSLYKFYQPHKPYNPIITFRFRICLSGCLKCTLERGLETLQGFHGH